MQSYLAPGLKESVTSGKNIGTFAERPLSKGTVLAVFGGSVVTREGLAGFSPEDSTNCLQVASDLYLVPSPAGPGDHINHSCDPNAGILGQIILVAMRDISAGEEICYDYAMTDSTDYDEFVCACGTARCRGQITGSDYLRADLQERYRGYFSSYIQTIIGV